MATAPTLLLQGLLAVVLATASRSARIPDARAMGSVFEFMRSSFPATGWPNGLRLSGDGGEAGGVRCSRGLGRAATNIHIAECAPAIAVPTQRLRDAIQLGLCGDYPLIRQYHRLSAVAGPGAGLVILI